MKRKLFKSHFEFNKQERSGIFFLLLPIVIFQIVYFVIKSYPVLETGNSLTIDEEYQAEIDALVNRVQQKDSFAIYPFNPNFITDYKGYILGMSPEEIDRLHVFRAGNQFVNSVEEFQRVTLVSDSLLKSLGPYFKFPEWTKGGKKGAISGAGSRASGASMSESLPETSNVAKVRDLNEASAEELKAVKGVGDILSQRIVKFRDLLGGFLVEEQLGHVYGLEPEVVERVLNDFKVLESAPIAKININQASPREISKLVYIKYELAARIVAYREANGGITSFDKLREIEGFPSDRLDIIKLYLQL